MSSADAKVNDDWGIKPSLSSVSTINPIRNIVDKVRTRPH